MQIEVKLSGPIFERIKSAGDWEEKYRRIIAAGQKLASLSATEKTDDIKVRGCQAQVWLVAALDAKGHVVFRAESDALIVNGLIALLLEEFSARSPDEILQKSLQFIEDLGLAQHLSPSRTNGLHAMIKQMKFYALAYKAKGSAT